MQVRPACLKAYARRPDASQPVIRLCLDRLGFGRCPLLAAALLMLDDGNGLGHVLHAPVAAVGPSVELAVVVQIILAVELILAAELAAEPVGAFAVETMIVLVDIAGECSVCHVLTSACGVSGARFGGKPLCSRGNHTCTWNDERRPRWAQACQKRRRLRAFVARPGSGRAAARWFCVALHEASFCAACDSCLEKGGLVVAWNSVPWATASGAPFPGWPFRQKRARAAAGRRTWGSPQE